MHTSIASSKEQTSSLSVNTDKASYQMGDTIVLSGSVKPVIGGTRLTIIILDPNYLLLQAEQVLVSPDGSFQSILMTTPYVWKVDGMYTISAQYGTSNVKDKTTFNFTR
jgi:hypothetical protein